MPDSQLPTPSLSPALAPTEPLLFFFLLLNHYHKWHPPFRRLASATVKNPFTTRPSLSCDSVVSRSTGGWQEVKRIWCEGSGGVEEMAKAVKRRAKGLYGKSITLFQFSDIWLRRDKAKASLPEEQCELSSHHKSIFISFLRRIIEYIWRAFAPLLGAGSSTGG